MLDKTKIMIPCTATIEFVMIRQIVRVEAMQNYSKVFLKDGQCLISNLGITKIGETLVNHSFFMSHKSHLINQTEVLRYYKEGQLMMSDGSRVPLARRRKESFFNSYKPLD